MGRRKNYPWDSRVDKQMTNLVSGLITGLIFAPFAILDSIPNNTNNLNTEPVSKKPKVAINVYKKLVSSLSKTSKIANSIKTDYNSIIKSNVEIKQKIETLNNTIDTYKRNLKIFGFIPKVKKRYFSKIKASSREIHFLNTFNKVSASTEEINGYVYLDINTIISAGKSISLDKLAQNKKKTHLFYAINKEPLISLQFKNIELYFFDDVVAFMTEDAYTVIDNNTVFLEYRSIPLECSMANKDATQFNILDTRCRHFCKDGTMDLRYFYYRLIELGVLELNIASEKVNLLFSNAESGSKLYHHLINNLGFQKKARICRYSYRHI